MFLLVPAYPGSPRPKAVKRLCVLISNRRKISISESGISETPRMMSYLQGRIYSKLFRKKNVPPLRTCPAGDDVRRDGRRTGESCALQPRHRHDGHVVSALTGGPRVSLCGRGRPRGAGVLAHDERSPTGVDAVQLLRRHQVADRVHHRTVDTCMPRTIRHDTIRDEVLTCARKPT